MRQQEVVKVQFGAAQSLESLVSQSVLSWWSVARNVSTLPRSSGCLLPPALQHPACSRRGILSREHFLGIINCSRSGSVCFAFTANDETIKSENLRV